MSKFRGSDTAPELALDPPSLQYPKSYSYLGTAGDDRFFGRRGSDYFHMEAGGYDKVWGKYHDAVAYFGSSFDPRDEFHGGSYNDTLVLDGDYADLTITGKMLDSVETIQLFDGSTYSLTLAANLLAEGEGIAVAGTRDWQSQGPYGANVTIDASQLLGRLTYTNTGGHDTIIGGSGDDTFITFGNAVVAYTGNAGADTFQVSRGTVATVIGGADNDRLVLYDTGGAFDLRVTDAQTYGSSSITARGIEFLVCSWHDDTLTGTSAGNWIFGGGGNDKLFGLGGDDFLEISGGTPAPVGVVSGGAGFDVIGLSIGSDGGTLDLSKVGFQDTGHGTFQVTGIEGISGSSGDDVLMGDRGDNQIYGGRGARRRQGRRHPPRRLELRSLRR